MPDGPSAPLRILHVVLPTEVGGMQRVIEALATGHRRRGHEVALAAVLPGPPRDEPPILGALRAAGVAIHAVRVPGRAYGRERAAVAELCRTLGPRVVHTHGYRPDVVDAPAARRLGLPTVTTVHGFTGGGWKDRLYERLQLRAFRRFDAVIAVSVPQVEQLARAGTPRERIHLVRNAWMGAGTAEPRAAARAALGLPAEGLCIGWIGRLTREKGADVLVRAMAALGDLPVSAAVVGDGPEAAPARALAARLGVADRIAWPGLVPGAGRLLAAFDAFVLSSRSEGTPIVLLEAMAATTPIVATAVGGVPDVVGPGEALLVPPEDPGALAAAVRAVLADPAAASGRALKALERLGHEFAEEPWLDRYESVYRTVGRL
ncbi:MAG TPA: glycosyltransferase family 4 protein [Gemmatimonadales bacterium]|nr:glycosyltransferase family 4 protein [Gemmatimonadales bacterium]